MVHNSKSIRPFIGSKDFNLSRAFYKDLGFEETVLSPGMSVFKNGDLSFYLQNAYVKDWIDNTMIFLEVANVQSFWNDLQLLNLPAVYKGIKLSPIVKNDWGSECFIHDPSGVLWHVGEFYTR